MATKHHRSLFLLVAAVFSFVAVAAQGQDRYAAHSMLREGRWVKIRVPQTGIYHLSDSLLEAAGFTDKSLVRVYGYGGALQPVLLTESYLVRNDDLPQVPLLSKDGELMFHAVGPVSWNTSSDNYRQRNNYSEYGYYFLTEAPDNSQEQLTDSAAFASTFYPSPFDYHSLYEVDDFAWYHGGSNLYDSRVFNSGTSRSYPLQSYDASGTVTLQMTFDGKCSFTVSVNGTTLGTCKPGTSVVRSATGQLVDTYAVAGQSVWTLQARNVLTGQDTVTIEMTEGGTARLDYISLRSNRPRPMCRLDADSLPQPEIVGAIENQDLHAHGAADMIIIVPESGKLIGEATRLADFHKQYDNMVCRVVRADQIFNEFSSGTPDATAYRRYMKMLYDRAGDDSAKPSHLLLFGDGAWDNRMVLSDWKSCSPKDFLLCYESENSYSELYCYVTDDYFCLLDDGEGSNLQRSDKPDVAVGRFPVRTADEARVMVDKVIDYSENAHAGHWQNTLCFLADGGDQNMHMNDAEVVLDTLLKNHPDYDIRKIYFDAYKLEAQGTSSTYPQARNAVLRQMQEGALVMNYTGHGASTSMSKKIVVYGTDFKDSTSMRLPLWVTASCHIMPFDDGSGCIGESAVLNKNGGAIAFFGTTRTVFAYYNQYMNRSFMVRLLEQEDSKYHTLGEAARLAKCDLITSGEDRTQNKLQFSLLGDPALRLKLPDAKIRLDSLNGVPVSEATGQLQPGVPVSVSGTVPDAPGFSGRLMLMVKDGEQQLHSILGQQDADTAFLFKSRTDIVVLQADTIDGGHFNTTFVLPRDLAYNGNNAQLLVWAVSTDRQTAAHGSADHFTLGGDGAQPADELGPVITAYINTPSFENGTTVGPQVRFVADVYDEDGLNLSDAGVGHSMQLAIDGRWATTYNLNNFFSYRYGDYRRGTVDFTVPQLSAGLHRLKFSVWDVFNNPGETELFFVYDPSHDETGISETPASTPVRSGEVMRYDLSGRRLSAGSTPSRGIVIVRDGQGRVTKKSAY